MGYIRGFVHGTIIGTVVGLCVAPQPGKRTRDQLSAFGIAARDGYDVAQRTVRRVAPFASSAAHLARDQVDKARRHSDATADPVGGAGTSRSHPNHRGS